MSYNSGSKILTREISEEYVLGPIRQEKLKGFPLKNVRNNVEQLEIFNRDDMKRLCYLSRSSNVAEILDFETGESIKRFENAWCIFRWDMTTLCIFFSHKYEFYCVLNGDVKFSCTRTGSPMMQFAIKVSKTQFVGISDHSCCCFTFEDGDVLKLSDVKKLDVKGDSCTVFGNSQLFRDCFYVSYVLRERYRGQSELFDYEKNSTVKRMKTTNTYCVACCLNSRGEEIVFFGESSLLSVFNCGKIRKEQAVLVAKITDQSGGWGSVVVVGEDILLGTSTRGFLKAIRFGILFSEQEYVEKEKITYSNDSYEKFFKSCVYISEEKLHPYDIYGLQVLSRNGRIVKGPSGGIEVFTSSKGGEIRQSSVYGIPVFDSKDEEDMNDTNERVCFLLEEEDLYTFCDVSVFKKLTLSNGFECEKVLRILLV